MTAGVRAVVVGRAWGQLGSILVPCGPSWVHLRWSGVDRGPTWACLGSSCGEVENPWGLFGPPPDTKKVGTTIKKYAAIFKNT